ncbi:hypothetical protein [Oryzihumus sp.]
MRWDRLFEDFEAQLEAERRLDLELEVADRTRRERATRGLQGRLVDLLGCDVDARVAGGARASGVVVQVGQDWVILEAPAAATAVAVASLVPFHALRVLTPGGSGRRGPADGAPQVSRRFGLGHALRGLSRDRVAVRLQDIDGRVLTGTIDGVGADLVELSEHPLDVPRRREHVVAVRWVPFAALAMVTRG